MCLGVYKRIYKRSTGEARCARSRLPLDDKGRGIGLLVERVAASDVLRFLIKSATLRFAREELSYETVHLPVFAPIVQRTLHQLCFGFDHSLGFIFSSR